MRIIAMELASDDRRWDAYVGPLTTAATDLAAWRHVVTENYGMRSHFFAVERSGRLVGAIGLYEVAHRFLGHYLATAAFGNDGGLFFENSEVRDLLTGEARRLADRLDVAYLVIRCRGLDLEGFTVDNSYRAAVIDLGDGEEAFWEYTLRAKTRNQARRGMREGFDVACGHDQVEAFHEVLHRHMRDLGSPVHGLPYYRSIAKHLDRQAEFLVVRDGREPVAGALLMTHGETAMNLHTVALKQYSTRCPNYLIYWTMIQRSFARGCRRFDMGRSPAGSPVLKFKENWHPDLVPISYNYYLRKQTEIPYVDPRNPRYRLPRAVWKRLPLWLSRSLGPRLISGLV